MLRAAAPSAENREFLRQGRLSEQLEPPGLGTRACELSLTGNLADQSGDEAS